MERRFWEPRHGLYADEAAPDWSALDPYRGQNANMHACEALLAAFEATGDPRYLHRAEVLAKNITQRQAELAEFLPPFAGLRGLMRAANAAGSATACEKQST